MRTDALPAVVFLLAAWLVVSFAPPSLVKLGALLGVRAVVNALQPVWGHSLGDAIRSRSRPILVVAMALVHMLVGGGSSSATLPPAVCVVCYEEFGSERMVRGGCATHPTCSACFASMARSEIQVGKLEVGCAAGARACGFLAPLGVLTEHVSPDMISMLMAHRSGKHVSFSCEMCGRGKRFEIGPYRASVGNRIEVRCTKCKAAYCVVCFEYLGKTSMDDAVSKPKRALQFVKSVWSRRLAGAATTTTTTSSTETPSPSSSPHKCRVRANETMLEYLSRSWNACKPCPHCLKLTHRFEGCPNMTCNGFGGCQNKWCWNCGAPGHHSEAECNAITTPSPLRPNTGRSLFTRRMQTPVIVSVGLHLLEDAVAVPVAAVGAVIMLPYFAFANVRDHYTTFNHVRLAEHVVHHGLHVYVRSTTERALTVAEFANSSQGLVGNGESRASEFVSEFARATDYHGRYCAHNRCFVAYGCLDGAAMVTLHAHDPSEACQAAEPPMVEVDSRLSMELVVGDGIVGEQDVVASVSNGCRDVLQRFYAA